MIKISMRDPGDGIVDVSGTAGEVLLDIAYLLSSVETSTIEDGKKRFMFSTIAGLVRLAKNGELTESMDELVAGFNYMSTNPEGYVFGETEKSDD